MMIKVVPLHVGPINIVYIVYFGESNGNVRTMENNRRTM
jgi:hypothetical protein